MMRTTLLAMLVVAVAAASSTAQIVRKSVGANAAAIQAAVDQFRADLGALQTGPSTGVGPNARREINWDGVPDAFASPNSFPGDFFNQATGGRARGALFTTGSGTMEVSSSTSSGVTTLFGNRNTQNADQFAAFSAERIFSLKDTLTVDMTFSLPGSPGVPATVRGFGVVFADVELADAAKIELFDVNNVLLFSGAADPFAFTGGDSFKSFSFIGASYADPIVSRVRISNGGYDIDFEQLGVNDATAMDDFIYGEPVAVPETGAVLIALVSISALWIRRR
jgi:type II secretory pathway pseudopilin PulG